MTTKFIGKNIRKKVIRPIKNSVKYRKYNQTATYSSPKIEEEVNETEIINVVEETAVKKENKRQKKNKEMITENKLAQMEAIAGTDIPNAKVKVEKGDKGLYERTENSTILLTEDNKMLLND